MLERSFFVEQEARSDIRIASAALTKENMERNGKKDGVHEMIFMAI